MEAMLRHQSQEIKYTLDIARKQSKKRRHRVIDKNSAISVSDVLALNTMSLFKTCVIGAPAMSSPAHICIEQANMVLLRLQNEIKASFTSHHDEVKHDEK